jgi:hypothetical protein
MAAVTIWYDPGQESYICAATAQIATDVAAFINASTSGPRLGLGLQLLCLEDGGLYLWDNATFKKFGV